MTNANWNDLIDKRHPDAKPIVAATASAPATESEAVMRARIAAEQMARAQDITNACAVASHPEKAAAFIADPTMTLSKVLAALSVPAHANGSDVEAATRLRHAARIARLS